MNTNILDMSTQDTIYAVLIIGAFLAFTFYTVRKLYVTWKNTDPNDVML